MFQPINHVSVSPTDGNGPTQGQRKTLTRVVSPFSCSSSLTPFPKRGKTRLMFFFQSEKGDLTRDLLSASSDSLSLSDGHSREQGHKYRC